MFRDELVCGEVVFEDELPEDMTDEEYDKWYETSYVPDGVGCRMRPWLGLSIETIQRIGGNK